MEAQWKCDTSQSKIFTGSLDSRTDLIGTWFLAEEFMPRTTLMTMMCWMILVGPQVNGLDRHAVPVVEIRAGRREEDGLDVEVTMFSPTGNKGEPLALVLELKRDTSMVAKNYKSGTWTTKDGFIDDDVGPPTCLFSGIARSNDTTVRGVAHASLCTSGKIRAVGFGAFFFCHPR